MSVLWVSDFELDKLQPLPEALLMAMKALATFAGKHPELDQIEINPLLLYDKGLFAVDVRIFSRI